MRHLILGLLLGLVGCAGTTNVVFTVDDVRIESWEQVEPAEMNDQIIAAVTAGEAWPNSPLSATVRLWGGDTDARILRIESRLGTEDGDTSVVVLVRDGFLGDSVRGDWHRIVYRRQP